MALSTAVACKDCALYRLCLPTNISEAELNQLESIIIRHPPIAKGRHWIRSGDAFKSICAVRSGSLKLYRTDEDGTEQITGVYFPGELIGLDAIHSGYHAYSAKALETTSVCEIPYHALEQLSERVPELSRQLVQIMSREMGRDHALISTLSHKTAEQRVAWLLLRVARGMERRGGSPRDFVLSLSRNEIGNYLGLAVETVSRVFTRLQQQGLIRSDGRSVHVPDVARLEHVAFECAAA